MEWINFIMDHSGITIIFLVLCLIIFNFGSFICLIVIILATYFGGAWLLDYIENEGFWPKG